MRAITFERLVPEPEPEPKTGSVLSRLSPDCRAPIIAKTEAAKAMHAAAAEAAQHLTQAFDEALKASILAKAAEQQYPGLCIERIAPVPTGEIPDGTGRTYTAVVSFGKGLHKMQFQTPDFKAPSVEDACSTALTMAAKAFSKHGYNESEEKRLAWARRHLKVTAVVRTGGLWHVRVQRTTGGSHACYEYEVMEGDPEAAARWALLMAVSDLAS